jgi:glutamine synthetase
MARQTAVKTKTRRARANKGSRRETERSLTEKGVRYCLPFYVDVHGVPKTKTVPIDHFDRMMRGSELFTGAALDGLGQGPQDDELAVHPDPDAVVQLPWRPEVAIIPGQLKYHDAPWPMCSRTILAKQETRPAVQPGYRMRGLFRPPRRQRAQRHRPQRPPRRNGQGGL